MIDEIREESNRLIQALKKKKLPELSASLLAKEKTVTDTIPEAKFYLYHQMIEIQAGALFHTLRTLLNSELKSEDETRSLLEKAIQALDNMITLIAHFNHYVRPEEFQKYRPALGGASGIQSPLQYLSQLLLPKTLPPPHKISDNYKEEVPEPLKQTHNEAVSRVNPGGTLFNPNDTPPLKALDAVFPEFLRGITTTLVSYGLRAPSNSQDQIKKVFALIAQFKLHHLHIVQVNVAKEQGPIKGTATHDPMLVLSKSYLKSVWGYHQVLQAQRSG